MIRKLISDDHEQFSKLRLLGLESYPVAFATMASDWNNAKPEQTITPLKDSESESSNYVFGAFEKDQLVGLIGLKREVRQSVDHKGSLWGLIVAPDYQRKGYGRLLLSAAIDEAKKMNLLYLRIVTATSSANAISLFNSVGFCQYGLEENSIKDGKQFYDQIYMKLLVQE